jgi:hypothetical protein
VPVPKLAKRPSALLRKALTPSRIMKAVQSFDNETVHAKDIVMSDRKC